MKKILNSIFLLLLFALPFSSCNQWTQSEDVGIKGPSFPTDDPEGFARYTAALRTYKSLDHIIVYGWFDNSAKIPTSRAEHIASLPDSMDIVSLLKPDNLANWELAEFTELRTKGTKVIFTFDYDQILTDYKASLPPVPEPEPQDADQTPATDAFLTYLSKQTSSYLSLVDKYSYDGVAVLYQPMPLLYLAPEEQAIERARQQAFTAQLKVWRKSHKSKLFIFEGQPQNLEEKSLLPECNYVVVRAFSATSHALLSIAIRKTMDLGVPADRVIAGVESLPLDPSDLTTGRFADLSGALSMCAISEAAKWVASPSEDIAMVGLAINNIQRDYYATNYIYRNVREAINIMNPSPKK